MISLEQYKQILGKEAERLTDEQIKRLREQQYLLADVLFDLFKKEKQAKNK